MRWSLRTGAPETAGKAILKGKLVLYVDSILWAGNPVAVDTAHVPPGNALWRNKFE